MNQTKPQDAASQNLVHLTRQHINILRKSLIDKVIRFSENNVSVFPLLVFVLRYNWQVRGQEGCHVWMLTSVIFIDLL